MIPGRNLDLQKGTKYTRNCMWISIKYVNKYERWYLLNCLSKITDSLKQELWHCNVGFIKSIDIKYMTKKSVQKIE